MCYSLTRCVVAEDESHIVLTPGWQPVDVVAGVCMYFKVCVWHRDAPGIVQLQYAPG